MGGRHSSHYEAHEQTVNLEDITSSDDNAAILPKIRADDPGFISLGIEGEYPDDEDDFIIRREDDMGWLGYFVAKNSTLKYLCIDIYDECDFLSMLDRFGVFIEGLNRNQSIEEIHIGSDLGSKNFRRLGHFFCNNNNLRELSFGDMDIIGIESARGIAYMLSRCEQSTLRRISFDNNGASEVVLAEIANAISNHSQLEELDLDGNNLGREGCVALGNALKVCRNPQLQNLYLRYNGIDDVGLSSLVTGLRNCCNLTRLALNGNELITVDGYRSLSTLFQSERCCLECLTLETMNMGDDGLSVLAPAIASLQLLKYLHLSQNSIGNEGSGALAAGSVNLRSLKTLNLSGNSIGDEGATILADGLVHLRSLEKLDFAGNSIGDDGISALAIALASLQSLEELSLSNNSIGDDGLQALVEGISNHCSISKLNLSYNSSITSLGVVSLSTLLRSKSFPLTSIFLLGIHFGDVGATALANGLEGNMILESLIFNLAVTPVGWSAFSRLLCNTSSVNSTYLSNHSIEIIGSYTSAGAPDDVKRFLALNKQLADDEVAIQKIVESHPDFDVEPFFEWNLRLFPHVMSTLERVHTPRYDFDKAQEEVVSKYSGQKLRRKLQSMKLSTMYKFVRGMPLVVVDCFDYQSYIHAALLAPIPRKRNFEQLCD